MKTYTVPAVIFIGLLIITLIVVRISGLGSTEKNVSTPESTMERSLFPTSTLGAKPTKIALPTFRSPTANPTELTALMSPSEFVGAYPKDKPLTYSLRMILTSGCLLDKDGTYRCQATFIPDPQQSKASVILQLPKGALTIGLHRAGFGENPNEILTVTKAEAAKLLKPRTEVILRIANHLYEGSDWKVIGEWVLLANRGTWAPFPRPIRAYTVEIAM